jgi:acetyltransferase-like isoleucine patch superfamily enzyme
MLAGELYLAADDELRGERRRAKALCATYNRSPVDLDTATLHQLFGYATDAYLEPPFFCDYGYNIRLGSKVYANHNLIILDGAPVSIGNNVLIGPNVVISNCRAPRRTGNPAVGLEFVKPIAIGNNVWIGAGVNVLPGVEIGDNATIGAGAWSRSRFRPIASPPQSVPRR